MEKKTITNILVECVLIIISILIAMLIDEYREGKKERQDEIVYLKSIREDLVQDTTYFKKRIFDFDLMYAYTDSIIDLFQSRDRYQGKVPKQFLDAIYQADSSYIRPFEYTVFSIILPIYFQNSASYESMKSSGDLKLIRNNDLLKKLNRHYSRFKFADIAANNELKRITDMRRAFLIKSGVHFDFQMDVETASQYLKSTELVNLTFDTRQVVGFVNGMMNGKRKEAKEIIHQIDDYLK